MYRHIVVATDGSELAMGAVGHAVDIARVFSATLTIVTVVDTLPVVDRGGLVISPSTFDQMRQATLPFANGVSLMVYGPGGYKFGDFWPLGLVVLIWTLIVTVIVTPLYWPYH